jgi:hypothetical protein
MAETKFNIVESPFYYRLKSCFQPKTAEKTHSLRLRIGQSLLPLCGKRPMRRHIFFTGD